MLKNIPLDKAALLTIPYLFLVSVCYDNGYWSVFFVSIFSYYEPQDIVKDITGPIFRFSGLLALPIFAILVAALSWFRKDAKEDKKEGEEKPNDGKPKNESFLLKLSRAVTAILLLAAGVAVISAILAGLVHLLFPYEEESEFLGYYLKSLNSNNIARGFSILIFPAVYSGLILTAFDILPKNQFVKFLTVVMSLSLSLIISYHFGRMDGMKIAVGEEFRYNIDKNGKAHKYLGKINKYYFFVNDVKYIDHKGDMSFSIDTMVYQTALSVVTDDSLKSLELDYYGSHTVGVAQAFSKAFHPRNSKAQLTPKH